MIAMHWRQVARRLTGGLGSGEKLKIEFDVSD
jgi:hypothetical protein